jgi:hypothetical protein
MSAQQPAREEILTDVQESDLRQYIVEFTLASGIVTVKRQADGLYSLTATYGAQNG